MNDRMKRDLDAISNLVNDRLAYSYASWHLSGLNELVERPAIIALYPPRESIPFTHFAVFGEGGEVTGLYVAISNYKLPSRILGEQLTQIEAWQLLDDEITEGVIKVHEDKAASLGIPITLLVTGVVTQDHGVAQIFHPTELPTTLCFEWIQNASRKHLTSRN